MAVVHPVGADPAYQGEGIAFGLALRRAWPLALGVRIATARA
jgi:hypothetical protein